MLISHKYKFAFFNIPKTGTVSARFMLEEYCDVIGGAFEDDTNFYQHESAYTAKEKFCNNGWNWDEYFKFTIIRNPWHRYASLYVWARYTFEALHTADYNKLPKIDQATYNKYNKWFNEFNFDQKRILRFLIHHNPSQDYFFLIDNKNSMSYTGRIENICEELKHFCHTVGIKDVTMEHQQKSRPYEYKDFYDQELIDLVAKKEKYTIDNFNYQY